MIFREEWDKYVVPFIKHPGCISKDPVVAAAHLTSIQWMEALGGQHYSRTDPKWNVKKFTARLLKDERLRVIAILRKHKVSSAAIEMEIYPA